jgi:hypothetical protein
MAEEDAIEEKERRAGDPHDQNYGGRSKGWCRLHRGLFQRGRT